MRKLIVAEHLSLDGVIQGPGGPTEDPSGDFTLGGWSFPFNDDAGGEYIEELHGKPFELLLGRFTYDIWASYWPHIKADSPAGGIAAQFNGTRKHVATHRAETLAWKNSHAIKGDLASGVRALLKEEGPPLVTWGSADMVRQLMAAGLVDELWLLIYPVVLGNGKRLFDGKAQASSFKLLKSVTTPKGVFLTRYARAGAVRTGSFEDVK